MSDLEIWDVCKNCLNLEQYCECDEFEPIDEDDEFEPMDEDDDDDVDYGNVVYFGLED